MKLHFKQFIFSLLTLIFLLTTSQLVAQTYAKNGMVVSASKIASQTGVDVLKQGGNAVDATIATAFALTVTHPTAGNIGGGGFIVFLNSEGEATTIDFREKAPLASSETMFLDENGNIKDNSNHKGLLAVGVPGTVAGLYLAHQKYGKLPWKDLVQPAVDLAEKGFEFNWTLYGNALNFKRQEADYPFMATYFNNDKGEITQPNEVWKQQALANTLKQIRDKGRDGFYKGKVAKKIESYMKANGGIITTEDLEKYDAIERKPVKGTYKGYDIYGMPPPSSGGATLIQMMNTMELVDWENIEFNSTEYVHVVAEAMRRAYADRAEHLGDPDFNPDMPIDRLLSKKHAKNRFENLNMERASVSDSSKFGQIYDGKNTTHFSVIDKDGNAISMTYTLENSYGVKMGSKELGFIFNNEMGDFNPVPGVTTSGWQIGTKPNLIAPQKRMLSSMTPTIVAKDGKPYLLIGSPGGRTIINTVFQTTLNVLEFDMRIDKAIEAMKIHHQWSPDVLQYERHLMSPDTRKALEAMGHTLRATGGLGALMGITYDAKNNIITGAADSSRPEGAAIGY
ncbi:gamma-glutamyltransferase [Flavobacteriaceae bacterium S0825]|uniref:gamma-glutamyltransferase n=1 Tax=Gaetbulibacter sp. S0825 TaxID=2720084 RepID=UPI001430F248|nr:gamma-glutamyltransferase [Gaetbulibacter sp. S0825]MCK0110297.1 gamma-glutamyltransferase [Flavobacteriaceae bacterium S0825]NIX65926.1 gamma-glutamyltransferase [Gaetbulibacter sp. S0825]